MRILMVHPGASYSTADVHFGLRDALRAQGHDIIQYQLDGRIATFGRALHYAYRTARKEHPDIDKPTPADVQFHAGVWAIERALRFMPDWVLIISGMYLHPDIYLFLKRAGFKTAVVLTESPYDDNRQIRILPFVDVAFANERTSLPYLRQANPNVDYLPASFDPARHRPDGEIPEGTPAHDVVFVGTYFQERIDFLSRVNWTGIDLGLYGHADLMGSRNPLRQFIRGEVQKNEAVSAMYRAAKIGLNMHRTSMGFGRTAPRIAYAESLGPRVWELAATGTFFLSDERAEGREVFGQTLPTYRSPAELEALIRQWLPRDAERAAVAAQLPALVEGHTFAARARQIVDRLEAAVPRLTAVS